MTYIGKIIKTERCAQRINQTMLAQGLCSVATLSRIETGDCFASAELIKELLSRVGKSADKLELIVSLEEYTLEEKKEFVLELADKKDLKQMKEEMESLKKEIKKEDFVNQRFLKEMQIIYQLLSGRKLEELGENLKNALAATTKIIDSNEIGRYCFSIEELKLWYLIVLSEKGSKENEYNISVLNRIKRDMDERKWDEEERVKLYPYVIYTLCELYEKEEKWDYVLEYSNAALHLLRENKRTSCILPLMKYKLKAMEQRKKENTEEYQNYAYYIRTWEMAKEITGFSNDKGILSIFQRNGQPEYFLFGEMLKGKRTQFHFTQAQISEELKWSEEFISRLENGKKNISKKNYEKLAESLQMQKEKAQSGILTSQYEILEKRRKIGILVQDKQYEKANLMLHKLKEQLDLSILENKQDLLCLETILLRGQKKLSNETALKNFIQALQFTIPQYPDIPLRECIFKKNEVTLLNNIASCYAENQEIEKAAQILEDTLFSCLKSKIYISNHCRLLTPLIFNFAKYTGLLGDHKKAIEYCQKAIHLNIINDRGSKISILFYTIGWNLKELNHNDTIYQQYCQIAYYIGGLMKEKERQEEILFLYQKNSGKPLFLENTL